MIVFRDGRRCVCGPQLAFQLVRLLEKLTSGENDALMLEALLRAGELECALADQDHPSAALFSRITDALAASVVRRSPLLADELIQAVQNTSLPETISVSVPEGFAYYGLHPLSYAAKARQLVDAQPAAVIGIRSVGTTLAGIFAAACLEAERITVRPLGHPFDRKTEFTGEQAAWISRQRQRGVKFFVVDEGPGLSGSSLLSVGEALVAAGILESAITFVCSRIPEFSRLRARDPAKRGKNFHWVAVDSAPFRPADATIDLTCGRWREHFLPDVSEWPASWTAMERQKYLSTDREHLFVFEGHGHYGEAGFERARRLAESGFAPHPVERENGYTKYQLVEGRVPSRRDLEAELIETIGRYCAWLRINFATSVEVADLRGMTSFNISQALHLELGRELELLANDLAVICDNRMAPHNWRLLPDGTYLKLNGAAHGDDHFFPGPTDVAWDLAGAIVEWGMDAAARDRLIRTYRHHSGDDPGQRLPAWILAYTAFRLGYCTMAAEAMCGSEEEARLWAGADFYKSVLKRQLHLSSAA
jgi:hypothetical protein